MIKILLLIVLVNLIPAKASAGERCQSIKYAGATGWQPISYINETGLYRGLVYDIMLEATKPLNIQLTSTPKHPWPRILDDLQKGKIDAVFGAYYNEERSKKFIYSAPITKDKIKLFVRHDNQFKFTALKDLVGKTGVRPFGGSYGDTFDNFDKKHLHLDRIKNSDLMLKMLKMGRVDFMVLAEFDGDAQIKKEKLTGIIIPIKQDVATLDIYVLYSKHSNCISKIPKINQAIEKIKEMGIADKLYSRYLQNK